MCTSGNAVIDTSNSTSFFFLCFTYVKNTTHKRSSFLLCRSFFLHPLLLFLIKVYKNFTKNFSASIARLFFFLLSILLLSSDNHTRVSGVTSNIETSCIKQVKKQEVKSRKKNSFYSSLELY